jgi:hypothetical protein
MGRVRQETLVFIFFLLYHGQREELHQHVLKHLTLLENPQEEDEGYA